jgi:hydrogenase nickel incorporation protein HypB
MCGTCGCDEEKEASAKAPMPTSTGTLVTIEQNVLGANDHAAAKNRAWLEARRILALNLVSSPGAGKTTLLERTIREVGAELGIGVIEGDQATENDAARIRAAGARAVQVNTGTGCHLDATMIERALRRLEPAQRSTVLIENVGNLVCPALFDLGERAKVVVISVTEGDDKPEKYPHMFRASDVMIVNKVDLAPYVSFDVERCIDRARAIQPKLRVFRVSATTGDGMESWYDWLRREAS